MNVPLPVRRILTLLLSSLILSGCGGGGGFIADPDDPTDPVIPEARYSLSGTLRIAAGIGVDSDINDLFASYTTNDFPSNAQSISNNALIHGFASSVGTGGNSAEELFVTTADTDDYFRVNLQAGQRIVLQVVDFSAANDLDLYLMNSAGTDELIFSDNAGVNGEFESITAVTDGEYLINVRAFSGISKYVLQIQPSSGATAAPADFVPGEVVVQYTPLAGIASTNAVSDAGPQLVRLNSGVQAASASAEPDPLQDFNPVISEKRRTLIEAKRLRQQDGVEWVEPNYIVHPTRIPNDSQYSQQWHYPAINLPQAWDITTGTANPEVIVAVIDTGVYLAHPDFSGQLVPGYDFISSASIARDGNEIDNNPDDPGDSDTPGASSWHGTHVAGTVAAATNNSGTGVAGTSWGAKIMPLRALGKGGGTTYDVAQSIRFAARLSNDSEDLPARKADIINLSLGSSQATNTERDAVAAARAAGVIIVAAAGNENVSTPFYPAAYPGVIGVSATRPDGNKASYSNFGNYIDIAAPGGEMSQGQSFGILSTYVDGYKSGNTDTRRPIYGFLQGTSMAAPHVAGVIALMKAVHPGLTETDIEDLITSCAITHKSGSCGRDDNLGNGRIDAYKAVVEAQKLAAGGTAPALPAIVNASVTQLSFGTGTTQLDFILSNIGGSSVTNLSVAVTFGSGWLSVAEQSVNAEKLGTYRATVNRTGLQDGLYSGTITVTYQDSAAAGVNKSLIISVQMQKGTITTAGVMTQQYVLLEDIDCTTSNCIRTVRASAGGFFTFSSVPAGNYRIYAGSDIDVDGFVCGAGETCGAYPSLGAEQIITLNSSRTGLGFLVNLTSGVGAAAAALPVQNLQRSDGSLQKSR